MRPISRREEGFSDDHLPPGYPRVLAVLDLIGLGSSGGIVALNLISMGAGLVCISTVLRRDFGLSRGEVNTICLLSCCSWMWVQLVTFPLSELAVFRAVEHGPGDAFAGEGSLDSSSRLVRGHRRDPRCGCLFRPDDWSGIIRRGCLWRIGNASRAAVLGRRAAIVLLTIGVGLAACLGIAHRDRIASPWYAGALAYLTTPHPLRTTEDIAWWRIGEVGELTQNVSSNAFAQTTPILPIDSISPWVYITLQLKALRLAFGILSAILILAGLWSRRRQFSPVEAYFMAYVGILFIWPFDDTRFFAPVLPLLFAFAWLGLCSLKPKPQTLRRFVVSYSAVFCIFGVVAMSDSLRVTFFDRQRPWRECRVYIIDFPTWLTAYDSYGGLRTTIVSSGDKAKRVVP